ncbi:CBS domain-containing protein [Candidatus Woesearchaeota archaeon]|nr:CBS domain-containing protein [Candidatus Woesearchaeota archaeon]
MMEKTAYDIARKKLYFFYINDPVYKIADIMQAKNIGSVLVKDKKDNVVGIVTIGDILRLVNKEKNVEPFSAQDIMSSPVIFLDKESSLEDTMSKFQKHKITRFVLIDENKKPVGIVRDLAVYKVLSFSKIYQESAERFKQSYTDHFY